MNSQTTDKLKSRSWPVLLRLLLIAGALLATTLISQVRASAQIVVAKGAVVETGSPLVVIA